MKNTLPISLIAFFAIACSKENNFTTQVNSQSNSAATNTTTMIPINDLGTGTFNGYTGGLYPGGLNHPTGSYATDLLKICHNITPLDTFGNPSAKNGKVLFVSLGWSTCGRNMRALEGKTTGNPLTNPKLLLVALTSGGGLARVNNIMNPNDPYWNKVAALLKDSNASFRQVQIIYLETEDSTHNVSFPGRPLVVKSDLQTCFRVFEQKFPNVKVVYLLARTTTFGSHEHFINTEPCPYYFGWACKWAIEDQINGVAGTAYKGKNKVSPIITWGFYQWADSIPRTTDGFSWIESETSDGLHANLRGQDSLSGRFQHFLLTDKYAKGWYAN
jgi:hypothetical protein